MPGSTLYKKDGVRYHRCQEASTDKRRPSQRKLTETNMSTNNCIEVYHLRVRSKMTSSVRVEERNKSKKLTKYP